MTRARRFACWLGLALAVAVLDQFTKELALAGLQRPIALLPSLNLVLVLNPGAAFGLLARAGGWQQWFLTGVAGAISAFILVWLWRTPSGSRLLPASLALVLGGAAGNLVDRVMRGAVVDFIDVYYGRFHWPAFNVADSAITVGVALLVLSSLRGREENDS